MKIAFVFPGQGSQTIGMGRFFYEAFSVFRDVYHEMDDVLSEKLSTLILDGTPEDLTLTHNAQPALLAMSLGVVRVLEHQTSQKIEHLKSPVAAGHSLGEYSALCAASAFGVRDAISFVRQRGQAMQNAVPVGVGAMSAVLGADVALIAEVCDSLSRPDHICAIANDNSPGQIVISGHKEAVEAVTTELGVRGVKRCIVLPVSAPFHSTLMQPAANVMQDVLNVDMSMPRMPVVMNVTAQSLSSTQDIAPLLVQQITGQVRWRESLLQMQEMGITHMIELGAGKVLCGLAKRTIPDVTALNIGTPEEMDVALKIIL